MLTQLQLRIGYNMDAKDYKDHILITSNAKQLKDFYNTPNSFPASQGKSYNDKYSTVYKAIERYCTQNNYNITPDEIEQWTIELIGNDPSSTRKGTDAFGRRTNSGTKSIGPIADDLRMPEIHYTETYGKSNQSPDKWYNKPKMKRELGLDKTVYNNGTFTNKTEKQYSNPRMKKELGLDSNPTGIANPADYMNKETE